MLNIWQKMHRSYLNHQSVKSRSKIAHECDEIPASCIVIFICLMLQDDKTDVVANDSGDRVMPAIVAFTDTEQVMYYTCHLCLYHILHCFVFDYI